MSSAALQAAPRQPTALASPPIQSPPSRQYRSSHSSPTHEAYHAHQSSAASPSSRRPTSRKSSGNAVPLSIETPPAALMPPTMSPSAEQSPMADRFANVPPVAPPRTSSNQQASSSRRGDYPTERATRSSRHAAPEPSSRGNPRNDQNGAPVESTRNKRAITTHFPTDSPGRSAHPRDPRVAETSMPTRNSYQPATSGSAREASDNITHSMSQVESPASRSATNHHQRSPREDDDAAAAAPPVVGMSSGQEDRRATRSRHDHIRSHRGTTKFGDFILGNTIGEGEFGKVKLGWKQDNTSVQVAIKLIKRDTVGSNPSRLAKIRREVTILRDIHHPNIVRLIDMVETDRYIGIILEYASGGELFDYILNHRYLKDHSARRLFSQLISGVGYLHKKGIVHRDLKLENLLLDRNRNIIITDFGFANTFDPNEDLAEEDELHLTDRDYVKRMGLDRLKPNGMRRGDLMQTSCGSPCYAAPELVVSDSLYTGRKVDVWSCGVILYAMLAGYLPFDDDPANPEGDNINLLYKYIVSTPLTFPEYVTPHARDLLRRILVPNPRKRADLFEVARHSWLSEYSHVVEFITSSTTLPSDVQNAAHVPEEFIEPQMVTRSSSVREASRQRAPQAPSVGGLTKAHGKIDADVEQPQRTPKDAKRRTVQVEYVAPITQTQRGMEVNEPQPQHRSASQTRRGPPEASYGKEKPLPQDPPTSRDGHSRANTAKRPPSSHRNVHPTRSAQGGRGVSDSPYVNSTGTGARPPTGGSMQSATSAGLQSRGNYGQPAPPTVADTNAQGSIQQPLSAEEHETLGRPSVSVPPKVTNLPGYQHEGAAAETKGHKRSNTLGDLGSKLLGRNGSVFGGRGKKSVDVSGEKNKRYPPVSMSNAMPTGDEPASRPSMDSKFSRRSFSLGLGKKASGSMSGSQGSGGEKRNRRRFSLLPPSFSLKAVGLGKEYGSNPSSERGSQQDLPYRGPRANPPRSVTAHGDARGSTPFFDGPFDSQQQDTANSSPVFHQRHVSAQLDNRRPNAMPPYLQPSNQTHAGSDPAMVEHRRPPTEPQLGSYQHDLAMSEGYDGRQVGTERGQRTVLQKGHKRFTDAYDQESFHGHEGSSGAAKRVMDFFRRRGKARGGDDRR